MPDLHTLTITEARKGLKEKKFTAVELAESYVKNIEARNGEINAYLEVFSDWRKQAEEAQSKIDAGEEGALLGIPLAMKDNILIHGKTASAASKMLENYVASYDATIVKKLKEAGAVFLGRTNMDEFAMGGSTENSSFGPTKNPYDTNRVPGGSSGGSAAAVAMDGALASIGTDTGGSIRQPASFCGLVGLKPTYGAVSRNGLIAMGSSFDQAGPLTRSVSDAEILHTVMAGKDPMDSTTIETNFYTKETLKADKLVVGIVKDLFNTDGLNEAVKSNIEKTVADLKAKGYEVKEIELPNLEYVLSVYYILIFSEVSSNLGRYDGIRYGLHVDGENLVEDYFKSRGAGFGPEVRRRIVLGTYVLSEGYSDEYYYKAKALRNVIRDDFVKAFSDVDVILTPTAPSPAYNIGEKINDPVAMYLEDIFTVTANITGMPAISIPTGVSNVDGKDLPIGMQFTANLGREDILFSVGKDLLGESN